MPARATTPSSLFKNPESLPAAGFTSGLASGLLAPPRGVESFHGCTTNMKVTDLLRPLALAAMLPVLMAGCGDAPTDPHESSEPVTLALQVSSTDGMVDLIVVEVTGPGIPVPILTNLVMSDGTASGSITVPAGQSRTFTARGFDAEGGITHEGNVTEDVRPGQAIVRIPLVPRGVGVPIEVVVSAYMITIDPIATEMNIGESRQFSAVVMDAEGSAIDVDPAALMWGSSNPVIATVDDEGMVTTGGQAGAARIVVSYQGVAAEADLVVTEDDLLSISLAVSSSEVEPGEPFAVVFTVRNRGAEAVSDLSVSLRVNDARLSSAPEADGIFPVVDDTGRQTGVGALYNLPGPVEPGEEVIRTAILYSYLIQGASILPAASIASWDGLEDPYLANNEASGEVMVTDGRIVFASDRNGPMNLFIANPDGTGLSQLTNNAADETYPAWSRDRGRIAFVRNGSLWVINADGTGETQLDVPADNSPTWSPDGGRIAVSGVPPGSAFLHILIYDFAAGSYSNLTAPHGDWSDWIHPDWSPDGGELIVLHDGFGQLMRVRADGSSVSGIQIELGGACYPLGGTNPRWSPDKSAIALGNGSILHEGHSDSGVDCDGGYSRTSTYHPDGLSTDRPSWSPNGHHLVFEAKPVDTGGATFDLLTIRWDGTGPMTNITNWPSNDIHPRW
jgi:Tol biopolymer transport system component